MSKGALSFNEDAVEWYTPKNVVDRFGSFEYDPATTKEQANYLNIPNYDTKETDGLSSDWSIYKRIWCNPPFNIKHQFFEKACETYKSNKLKNIYIYIYISTYRIFDYKKISQFIKRKWCFS